MTSRPTDVCPCGRENCTENDHLFWPRPTAASLRNVKCPDCGDDVGDHSWWDCDLCGCENDPADVLAAAWPAPTVDLGGHKPVVGVVAGRAGFMGCECMTAREYRALGFKGGWDEWVRHVVAAMSWRTEEGAGDE